MTFDDLYTKLRAGFDLSTFVITFLTTMAGAAIYVNTVILDRVDEAIKARTAPYETYLAANTYFIDEDADRCIVTIMPAVRDIEKQKWESVNAEPFFNLATACARDATDPSQHSAFMQRMEHRLDRGELALSSWHLGSFGWYYLRLGERERATKYLRGAASRFAAENDRYEESYARLGLTILALQGGDPAKAASEYKASATLNPREFDSPPALAPLLTELGRRHLRHLQSDAAIRRGLPQLAEELRKKPSTESDLLAEWLR